MAAAAGCLSRRQGAVVSRHECLIRLSSQVEHIPKALLLPLVCWLVGVSPTDRTTPTDWGRARLRAASSSRRSSFSERWALGEPNAARTWQVAAWIEPSRMHISLPAAAAPCDCSRRQRPNGECLREPVATRFRYMALPPGRNPSLDSVASALAPVHSGPLG